MEDSSSWPRLLGRRCRCGRSGSGFVPLFPRLDAVDWGFRSRLGTAVSSGEMFFLRLASDLHLRQRPQQALRLLQGVVLDEADADEPGPLVVLVDPGVKVLGPEGDGVVDPEAPHDLVLGHAFDLEGERRVPLVHSPGVRDAVDLHVRHLVEPRHVSDALEHRPRDALLVLLHGRKRNLQRLPTARVSG